MRVIALMAALCFFPVAALASGSVNLSVSATSLTSPLNSYGPWVFENVDIQLPPSRNLGLHFENRRASDRFNPSTREEFGVDLYSKLSHALTLYTGVTAGTGAPYPRDRFSLELDAAAGPGWVPFVGGSLGTGYGIGATQQLTAGTYYYFGDDYAFVRYSPSWSNVLGATQGYSLGLSLGHPGRTTHTFRAGWGGENDVSLITPTNPQITGEREFGAGYTLKHWTGNDSGFDLGIQTGSLLRAGGARIYSSAGMSAGLFFKL